MMNTILTTNDYSGQDASLNLSLGAGMLLDPHKYYYRVSLHRKVRGEKVFSYRKQPCSLGLGYGGAPLYRSMELLCMQSPMYVQCSTINGNKLSPGHVDPLYPGDPTSPLPDNIDLILAP